MTVESLRRSPLADHPLVSGRGVRLAEIPFLTAVDVQGPAAFPTPAAGEVVAWGSRSVLWLGPEEWLVVGPDGDAFDLPGGVDVSANRTTLELSGPNARDVLEKGCTLDLHPRAFSAGHCAQTTLARAQVLLWQTADDPVYRLMVRGSFATYLADWLADAAREYL